MEWGTFGGESFPLILDMYLYLYKPIADQTT